MLRRCIRYSCTSEVYASPAFSGSPVIRPFERGDTSEIRNEIVFDFYIGTTHTVIRLWREYQSTCFHPRYFIKVLHVRTSHRLPKSQITKGLEAFHLNT